jgi:RecB family exonuclease
MKIVQHTTTTFIEAKDMRLPRGYLSASQINKYLSCPKDYYFTYVLGKRFKANERMVLGSGVHKLIENSINLKVNNGNMSPGMNEVLDNSRTIVEEMYYDEAGEPPEHSDPEPIGLEDLVDLAQKSFIVWYKNKMPNISPVCAEKEALFTIGDIPIKGYIDYLDLTPSGVKVVDIKVSKKKRDPADSVQLALYAISEGTACVGFDTILQPTKRLPTRLEESSAVLEENYLRHIKHLIINVHRGITQGFFPECLPDHWLCNAKWCGNYSNCRGAI